MSAIEQVLREIVSNLNQCTCDERCEHCVPDELIERAEQALGLPFGFTTDRPQGAWKP